VIDQRTRRRPIVGGRVAGDDERAALAGRRTEHQVRALAVVPRRHVLQAEHRGVEFARLGVVRARIRDVIDPDRLEAGAGLGIGDVARRVDGGSERNGLAEFAAVHLAALEGLDQVSDESFHAETSLDVLVFEVAPTAPTLAFCRC
jgi:hypothetical protein